MNENQEKRLSFVIATNLALLDDSVLRFCADNDVFLSTSLDGPEDLHNKNRPRPGGDSWRRTVDGIRRIRETLGSDRVSALMTTTEASLDRVRDIIDSYLELGLHDVFLRPISPYGFAIRTKSHSAYDADRWLRFYEEGLEYILELNERGVDVVERYAAIILNKMLTNDDPGYVDLMSPSGIGIGAIVYNYDGDVYASDEGRMLAEMGDTTFRLGNVHRDSYRDIMTSDALLDPLEQSFTLERSDVLGLRLRALLWRRPRIPPRDLRRLPRPQAGILVLPPQYEHLQVAADALRRRPQARAIFQSWASR